MPPSSGNLWNTMKASHVSENLLKQSDANTEYIILCLLGKVRIQQIISAQPFCATSLWKGWFYKSWIIKCDDEYHSCVCTVNVHTWLILVKIQEINYVIKALYSTICFWACPKFWVHLCTEKLKRKQKQDMFSTGSLIRFIFVVIIIIIMEETGVRLPVVCRPKGSNTWQPPPPLSLQRSPSLQTSAYAEKHRKQSAW